MLIRSRVEHETRQIRKSSQYWVCFEYWIGLESNQTRPILLKKKKKRLDKYFQTKQERERERERELKNQYIFERKKKSIILIWHSHELIDIIRRYIKENTNMSKSMTQESSD